MNNLRDAVAVVIILILIAAGSWIGSVGSTTEIALLTVGCFLIDAIVYAVAVVYDRFEYHTHMITAMMVTGVFWLPCGFAVLLSESLNCLTKGRHYESS